MFLDLLSTQRSLSVEARPVRLEGIEFADGALEMFGLEESYVLALGYKVWVQEWVMRRVRGNIQFPLKSKVHGDLMLEPPPGVVMGVSWIKALGPQKSGPEVNLSLFLATGWEVVKEKKNEALAGSYWIL